VRYVIARQLWSSEDHVSGTRAVDNYPIGVLVGHENGESDPRTEGAGNLVDPLEKRFAPQGPPLPRSNTLSYGCMPVEVQT
jgi:hypothetical protein